MSGESLQLSTTTLWSGKDGGEAISDNITHNKTSSEVSIEKAVVRSRDLIVWFFCGG
jgi:hypothetical protein